ncbi:MAG TPA: response regulator [Polyangiales bacterium]
MSERGVLVVDDNATNLKLITVLLRTEGYSVRTASSAEEAWGSIQAALPDLVLMDVQLPGMDGLTLTRKLRADPSMQQLRIVALTAYAMPDDRQRALDAGCDAYIAKPIDTRGFPRLVRELLSKSRG